MFFTTPPKSDLTVTNGISRWHETYPMLIAGTLYPATLMVLYVAPSYELMDVELQVDADLKEHRMFDYASQMVIQHGLSQFMDWSSKEREKTSPLRDDPLFE